MKKLLIVIDMQNDFVTGALGSPDAQSIISNVKKKIEEYKTSGNKIMFTRDTHYDNYLETQEGKYLPIKHCIEGTKGHLIINDLNTNGCEIFDKPTFGSLTFAEQVAKSAKDIEEIELCGLCTDICVVSNAIILKARLPETKITVDAAACAGVTKDSHNAALLTMKMCQVNVINV